MNQEVIDQERLKNVFRNEINIAIDFRNNWTLIPRGLKASAFNEVASEYAVKGYHLSTNNGLAVAIQKKVAETSKSSEPIDYGHNPEPIDHNWRNYWQGYERAVDQAERRCQKEEEEYGGFANPRVYDRYGRLI